jgi:hypothetical protein
VYLILALGTLSELNHRVVKLEPIGLHDKFTGRALAVKPDLHVTISSLQALILQHWYLYTEVSNISICDSKAGTDMPLPASRPYPIEPRRPPRQTRHRARATPRPIHNQWERIQRYGQWLGNVIWICWI